MLEAAVAELLVEGISSQLGFVRSSMVRNGDVAAAAQDRLRASDYRGLRSLSCECHHGVLVLLGRVSSFHQKQLAQESVRRIPGVRAIVNRVEVTTITPK